MLRWMLDLYLRNREPMESMLVAISNALDDFEKVEQEAIMTGDDMEGETKRGHT